MCTFEYVCQSHIYAHLNLKMSIILNYIHKTSRCALLKLTRLFSVPIGNQSHRTACVKPYRAKSKETLNTEHWMLAGSGGLMWLLICVAPFGYMAIAATNILRASRCSRRLFCKTWRYVLRQNRASD